MTELLVQVEDNAYATLKKAILLLKGVKHVSVRKRESLAKRRNAEQLRDLPEDIAGLIGVAPISADDYRDERTSYILSK